MEAPKVLKPLENEQVNEGTPVLLQATIVGKPTPKVKLEFYWIGENQHFFPVIVCLAQR